MKYKTQDYKIAVACPIQEQATWFSQEDTKVKTNEMIEKGCGESGLSGNNHKKNN